MLLYLFFLFYGEGLLLRSYSCDGKFLPALGQAGILLDNTLLGDAKSTKAAQDCLESIALLPILTKKFIFAYFLLFRMQMYANSPYN